MEKRRFMILFAIALTVATPFLAMDRALADDAAVLLSVQVSQDTPPIGLTDADLLAMDQKSFVTSTLWTSEEHSFSGPSLRQVLEQVGADPSVPVRLVAANDYAVTLDPEMIDDDYPIIANRLDGETFSIREKGPLWVMYPFDQDSRYKTELHYSLSVWQLTEVRLVQPGEGPDAGN
ncbi:oxidoreductase [Salibaculum griseiflavum]|uniref:Oxidoreductase n=1 Tax=Salibaculum griseiflavum TaxID=1914409 RepID=A0A2V1P616_9RHOB|nr:oxidoreductase [Salibaculum griseiflavum]PWG17953.1 oxidoreductase [Salibaculum griseiflavum]